MGCHTTLADAILPEISDATHLPTPTAIDTVHTTHKVVTHVQWSTDLAKWKFPHKCCIISELCYNQYYALLPYITLTLT